MTYGEHVIRRRAAKELVEAARHERALLDVDSPERAFLLGVDAAAQEVLLPELGATRDDAWLLTQTPQFREGYVRTRTLIAQGGWAGGSPVLPLLRPQATPANQDSHAR